VRKIKPRNKPLPFVSPEIFPTICPPGDTETPSSRGEAPFSVTHLNTSLKNDACFLARILNTIGENEKGMKKKMPNQPPAQQQEPKKYITYEHFKETLDLVREAYLEQQKRIAELEGQVAALSSLLEHVEQRQVDLEKRDQWHTQKDRGAVAQPESAKPQTKRATPPPEPVGAPPAEGTHHSTTITDKQKNFLFHLAFEINLPGSKQEQIRSMIQWAEQKCQKPFNLLTQRDFSILKESLEGAKGKGALPTLQPGREYSNAS
jgi:hypothetical protein